VSERRAERAEQVADRIACLRLERDRVHRVGIGLRKSDLAKAVSLMDEVIDVLCAVKGELAGEQ
jgi:hypothetical protein